MRKLKWSKQDHPLWINERQREIFNKLNGLSPMQDLVLARYQWKADKFSIIYPCPYLKKHGKALYELYDGEECYTFKTLKEAKEFAERFVL